MKLQRCVVFCSTVIGAPRLLRQFSVSLVSSASMDLDDTPRQLYNVVIIWSSLLRQQALNPLRKGFQMTSFLTESPVSIWFVSSALAFFMLVVFPKLLMFLQLAFGLSSGLSATLLALFWLNSDSFYFSLIHGYYYNSCFFSSKSALNGSLDKSLSRLLLASFEMRTLSTLSDSSSPSFESWPISYYWSSKFWL